MYAWGLRVKAGRSVSPWGGGSLAWVRRAPAHKGESEFEQGEMGNYRRTQGKGEMVTYKSIDQMSK